MDDDLDSLRDIADQMDRHVNSRDKHGRGGKRGNPAFKTMRGAANNLRAKIKRAQNAGLTRRKLRPRV